MSDLAAVFQIGSLGDSIVSVPALLSIRELLPDCSEYVLVSKFDSSAKVLPNQVFNMAWKPKHEVSYTGPSPRLRDVYSISSALIRLRHYRPRYCVYLMPSDRLPNQVRRDALFFRAAGIRELVGFHAVDGLDDQNGLETHRTEAYRRFRRLWGEEANQRFAHYAKTPVLRPSDAAAAAANKWLTQNRRYPERHLVAFCPYSNWASKDIPNSVVAETVVRLEQDHKVEVIVLGGRKDRLAASSALSGTAYALNGCGSFSLEQSAAVLNACKLVICADSGPMHLAGALGKPTVVTFSRINPHMHRWLPLGTAHTILHREVKCAGCLLEDCPIAEHPCMREIKTEDILTVTGRRLNNLSVDESSTRGTKVLNW